MLQWTYEFMFSFKLMFFVFLGRHLGVERLGHKIDPFLIPWETSILFSIWVELDYIHTNSVRVCFISHQFFSHPTNICHFWSLYMAHIHRCANFDNMAETGEEYTKWCKSKGEGKMSDDVTYMCNLEKWNKGSCQLK